MPRGKRQHVLLKQLSACIAAAAIHLVLARHSLPAQAQPAMLPQQHKRPCRYIERSNGCQPDGFVSGTNETCVYTPEMRRWDYFKASRAAVWLV